MLAPMFPRGLSGVGLLLLRVVAGTTAVAHAWRAVVGGTASVFVWSIAVAAALVGVALLIGFVTSLAAGLISIGTVGAALGWIPWSHWDPIGTGVCTMFAGMCVAISLLGPGSLSVDARRRGHREIVIPADSSPTDSSKRKERLE